MLEGDSVYLLARRLDRGLKGRRLARSDLRAPKVATVDLAGRTVVENATHGKHLLTRLSGDLTLHTHLRMQGSWTVTRPGRQLPTRLTGIWCCRLAPPCRTRTTPAGESGTRVSIRRGSFGMSPVSRASPSRRPGCEGRVTDVS